MAGRVFIHVGSPKTGTTYLQGILWRHRATLRRRGLLLPLREPDHYAGTFQVSGWRQRNGPMPAWADGAWDRLVEATLRSRQDVLISHEMYCRATAEQAEKALAPLLDAGREVHVVITARDLARQIPAAWQEGVKTGRQIHFDTFVEQIQQSGHHDARGFRRAHDTAFLAERWGSGLPPEHVHVVTVPQRGAPRDLLWTRFATALGIDPDGYDDSVYANESLRVEQTELARRLNALIDGSIAWPRPWSTVVKIGFFESVLGGREGTPVTLGGADLEFARKRSARIVASLEKMGVDVVGSLDELLVTAEPVAEPSSARVEVGEDVLLQEALEAIASILTERAEQRVARDEHAAGLGVVRRTALQSRRALAKALARLGR